MTDAPAIYETDVDEMAAGQLAALAQVRGRLSAHLVHAPHLAATVVGIVDECAEEIVESVTDPD